MTDSVTHRSATSVPAHLAFVKHLIHNGTRMAKRSLRQSAVDLPLAGWLVEYGEARNWTSGRQMAGRLGINPAVFGTWLRGEYEPDASNQEQLHTATGETRERIAELVRLTKAAKAERAGRALTNGFTRRTPPGAEIVELMRATVRETLAQLGLTPDDAEELRRRER